MAEGLPPVDEERLPWLEPYRDAVGARPAAPKSRNARGAGLAIGGLAAIAAALTAGYYIGQRERTITPLPGPMAEAPVLTAPVPLLPSDAPAPVAPAPVAEVSPPAPIEPKAAPPKVAAKPVVRPPRQAVRKRKIRSAGIESARIREVRAAQEPLAAASRQSPERPVRRATVAAWPKMPSPGPAGQVVQLGAFRTEARAQAALRTRLSRYPVLGSMPRVIVPVVTKPRGQVLYVLRLGTASRQQSRVVCRNLRASGDHCIVIG
jgi:hypothetical protein